MVAMLSQVAASSTHATVRMFRDACEHMRVQRCLCWLPCWRACRQSVIAMNLL